MSLVTYCCICNSSPVSEYCCSAPFCYGCFKLHSCSNSFNNLSTEVTNSLSPEEHLKQEYDTALSNIEHMKSTFSNIPLSAPKLTEDELNHLIFITIDRNNQFLLQTQGEVLTKYDVYNNTFTYFRLTEHSSKISSSLCHNSDNIFVVGGLKNFIASNSIIVLRFNDCNFVREFELDQARYFCASICYENLLVVVGGLDEANNPLSTIEWFDLSNHTKGVLAMNKPRGRPSVLALNGKIYIAGKDSGKYVDVLDVQEKKITAEKFAWAQGPILMIANYCDKILVLADNGITEEKSGVLLKTWNRVNEMWSQQNLVGLDNFLYFFDYFTGQLVRIYAADFRFQDS